MIRCDCLIIANVVSPGSIVFLFFFSVISSQREVLGDGTDKPIPVAMCFDEMALQKDIQFDQATQTVHGPHDQAQVVMIRGLYRNFKQPVFFDFDTPVTKDILFTLMNKLDDIGFQVEAVINDMGSKNLGLWRELGVTVGTSHFDFKGRQVQTLADVPHLLKLLRNHLLDQGFFLQSGCILRKDDLKQLLVTDSAELRLHHKLKLVHFECKGSQRQHVGLAAQLLSRTTAQALRLLHPEKEEQAKFVQLINDAFDVLNSNCPEGHKEFDYAMGWESPFKKFAAQKEILQKARSEISAMRVVNNRSLNTKGILEPVKSLLPFQKGFLISIDAALELHEKLTNTYNGKFLLTCRINQDSIENLFSRIRYISGANTHPGCVEFMNRLRLIILAQSSDYVVKTASVQVAAEDEVVLATTSGRTRTGEYCSGM